MKKLAVLSLALLLSVALSGATLAGDKEKSVTLEGKIVCAKCNLKEEGRDQCQNVLVVKADDATKMFYLSKTEASEEFGHVCMAEKAVRVTGHVVKKDGKAWLAASEIVSMESKG